MKTEKVGKDVTLEKLLPDYTGAPYLCKVTGAMYPVLGFCNNIFTCSTYWAYMSYSNLEKVQALWLLDMLLCCVRLALGTDMTLLN